MKKIINTNKAPKPIGPYNQAVIFNGIMFISGQIAIDPISGELITDDIRKETECVLKNIKAILEEAGCTFKNVLKSSVFVKDINDFNAINEVYAQYFTDEHPARELVQVAELPRKVNVEISVIVGLEGF
ncbi:MAG: RidA family protein [Flavobacteriales bacterium]